MNNACPKCRDVALAVPDGRATRVLACPRCRGSWVPRDEARIEAVTSLLDTDSTIRPTEAQDHKTGLCPLGHGILIRARVEHEEPFYLDRCAECSGIWFDKGEWSKLASSHLMDNLDLLWDPTWRHRTRRDRAEQTYRDQLAADVGENAFEMMSGLAEALRDKSPRIKSAALAFLREELDRSPR